MPTVSVTTVEYLGQLFQLKKRPNALLRFMGAFNGAKKTTAYSFPIGAFFSLPAPSQPARLEGASAPTPNATTITQQTNVIQIFQEAVSLTYLALSENSISGVVPIPQGDVNGPVQNPRSQEFQVLKTMQKIAQDANFSFLNGQYSNPSDPAATALATRGVLTAISTNYYDQSAISPTAAAAINAATYRSWVAEVLLSMIQQNGYQIDETFLLMCGPIQYANAAAAYVAQGVIYITPELEVMGVKVRKVQTVYGTLLLVLDPDVPEAFSTTSTGTANMTTTIALTSVSGLNIGDTLNIDTAGTLESRTIVSISSLTVTLSSALSSNHASGIVVTRPATLAIIKADACGVVAQEVPGKGYFFEEPLYKSGSSEQTQLYGQLGIDHGPEFLHGLVKIAPGVAIPA